MKIRRTKVKSKRKAAGKLPNLLRIYSILFFQLRRKPIYTLFAAILIITVSAASFFYFKYQDVLRRSSTLGESINQEQEARELINKISKIVVLPIGESTIATVTNVETLTSQPFFANAQNGDKVLIYKNAKKAYLYRPSINKIIEIGPVDYPTPTAIKITPILTGAEVEQTTVIPASSSAASFKPTAEPTPRP